MADKLVLIEHAVFTNRVAVSGPVGSLSTVSNCSFSPPHRELRYLELSAAFGELREDFGLPPNLGSLSQLSQLRIKVRRLAITPCDAHS